MPNASIIGSISLAGEPSSMAYSPATGQLYSTNLPTPGVNDNIVIVNTKANPITTRIIHVGSNSSSNPLTIALNPVNGKVYTTNYRDQSVSVIDPSNNNSVTTIPIQTQHPQAIAFDSASGEVYVTAYGPYPCSTCIGSLTAIDPTTNSVTATVQVGDAPYSLVADPSTHNVYVANYADSTVDVISPSQGYAITHTISTGPYTAPNALALDAAGKVYAASTYTRVANAPGQVDVINPAQGYAVTAIPVGNTPLLITYDSGVNLIAALNSGSNTVSYISPTTLSVTATIAVGSQSPYTYAMVTNGSFKGTAVTNEASNSVSLIAD